MCSMKTEQTFLGEHSEDVTCGLCHTNLHDGTETTPLYNSTVHEECLYEKFLTDEKLY